jgi:hypothetical protein
MTNRSLSNIDYRKMLRDYISRMEGINERRCEVAMRDLQYTMKELEIFNRLREVVYNSEVKDEPPDDTIDL